jgi:hypothetical protein
MLILYFQKIPSRLRKEEKYLLTKARDTNLKRDISGLHQLTFGRSVGIVRSRTQTMEFLSVNLVSYRWFRRSDTAHLPFDFLRYSWCSNVLAIVFVFWGFSLATHISAIAPYSSMSPEVYGTSDQAVHLHAPRAPALAWLQNIDVNSCFRMK